MSLPAWIAKRAKACAVCGGGFDIIFDRSTGAYNYKGYRQSDQKTGERWVFCSKQCKEIWLWNPLGYPPSFIKKPRAWHEY